MAGDRFLLSESDVNGIVAFPEGHFGDVKSARIAPAKMSETVSAFANSDGGELYLGIDEDRNTKLRSWVGFTTMEDANAHVQVLSEVFQFDRACTFEFLEHPHARDFALKIEVPKTRSIIRASNGKAYMRRGAQNLPVDTDQKMRQLERNKGITSFETETVSAPIEVITNSSTVIGFMLDVVPTAEPEIWLRKQNCIVDEKPVVAGVVLFSDDPQALLPKRSGIKVYRYATDSDATRETLSGDPISIEGSAYDLIRTAVARTQEIIDSIPALGEHGFEAVRYPPETLHEIITNAVLHRDYSVPDDIHVRIFDNRIEVQSPGLLPGHITETNILRERFARNPMIVRLINKFPNPPNKDVGEGLNTAFDAMKTMKLRVPEILQQENSVLVNIRHTPLASPPVAILDYLETHDEITNSVGREITGIRSETSMKKVFDRMRNSGQIEPVPGKRGRSSAWRSTVTSPEARVGLVIPDSPDGLG